MTDTTEKIRSAWMERRNAEAQNPARVEFATSLLSELANGNPVTPKRAAELTAGVTEKEAAELFRQAAEQGAEVDENGDLVGNALTLNHTPHRFRIRGNDLYAWCSLDTLFLPALIGDVAEIESTCPISGETIQLTVGPEGLRSYGPPTAVSSVVVPGKTPSCDIDASTGPTSSTCTQMHFFANARAAATWARDHDGVEIVSMEQANEIARALADHPCTDCC